MFTCDCEKYCKEREVIAKKEHLGEAKGIKLLIRKVTWHPWIRNNNICDGGCPIWNDFHTKHFKDFMTSEIAKHIINMQ